MNAGYPPITDAGSTRTPDADVSTAATPATVLMTITSATSASATKSATPLTRQARSEASRGLNSAVVARFSPDVSCGNHDEPTPSQSNANVANSVL